MAAGRGDVFGFVIFKPDVTDFHGNLTGAPIMKKFFPPESLNGIPADPGACLGGEKAKSQLLEKPLFLAALPQPLELGEPAIDGRLLLEVQIQKCVRIRT